MLTFDLLGMGQPWFLIGERILSEFLGAAIRMACEEYGFIAANKFIVFRCA